MFPTFVVEISLTKFQQICETVYETREKMHNVTHSLLWTNITCESQMSSTSNPNVFPSDIYGKVHFWSYSNEAQCG
jgi:hypothetical protein